MRDQLSKLENVENELRSALHSYAEGHFADEKQMECLLSSDRDFQTFIQLVDEISVQVDIKSIDIESLKLAGKQIKDLIVEKLINIESFDVLVQRAFDSLSVYSLWKFELPNEKNEIEFRDCILFTSIMKVLLERKGVLGSTVYQTGRLHPFLYITTDDGVIRYQTNGTGDPIVEASSSNNLNSLLDRNHAAAKQQVRDGYLLFEEEDEVMEKLNIEGYVFKDAHSPLSMRHDDLIRLGAKIRSTAKYSFDNGLYSENIAANLTWIAIELQKNHLRMGKTGIYPNAVHMVKGLQPINMYFALHRINITKA